MGFVSDFLFGEDDTSAQDATQKLQSEQLALFEQLAGQARGDAIPLFGQADTDRNLGFQSAIDALQGGQPQFQNAILGLPTEQQNIQLPQFGGTAAVFPEQQVGFQPPPTGSNLSLADAQRAVFAAPLGSPERKAADARVRELLAGGSQGPLADALNNLLGAEKGSKARDASRKNVRNILGQENQDLNSLLSLLSGGQGGGNFSQLFPGGGSDPSSIGGIDVSTMSSGQKAQAIAQLSVLSKLAPFPVNVPMLFTKSMFEQDLAEQAVDPGNPEGAPGSGGTGSGSGAGVGHGGVGFGGTDGSDFGGV